MRVKTIQKRRSAVSAALAVSLLVLASISACGTNTTSVEFIPSQVVAQFAVFQDTTETAAGSTTTRAYGGAIFWQGVLTLLVEGGLVEVVAPGGTAYPMDVQYNPAGAAYYITSLPSFELNSSYTFRVTLPSGTQIANSITTPQNSLALELPAVGATMALNDYLVVDWTNSGPGNVAIVARRASTAEFFSVVGAGRVQAPDTGSFNGAPPHLPPVLVLSARELTDAGTGTRYLTVTRTTNSGVNGFRAGSFVQGSLVYAREVQLAP